MTLLQFFSEVAFTQASTSRSCRACFVGFGERRPAFLRRDGRTEPTGALGRDWRPFRIGQLPDPGAGALGLGVASSRRTQARERVKRWTAWRPNMAAPVREKDRLRLIRSNAGGQAERDSGRHHHPHAVARGRGHPRDPGRPLGGQPGPWLTSMLVISLFFAIALVPGVNHLHNKRGWKRGAAVGFIYLAGILALALLTLVLIPNIAQLAERVGQDGTRWLTGLDRWTSDTFGIHIVSAEASRDAAVTTKEFLGRWSDKLVGAASGVVSSGVGFVFNVATIATFTFYIAAGRARAGLPVLVQPGPPAAPGWTIDQSITQVGGHLYSRLLLTAINGLGFFVVMVAVGVPLAWRSRWRSSAGSSRSSSPASAPTSAGRSRSRSRSRSRVSSPR